MREEKRQQYTNVEVKEIIRKGYIGTFFNDYVEVTYFIQT